MIGIPRTSFCSTISTVTVKHLRADGLELSFLTVPASINFIYCFSTCAQMILDPDPQYSEKIWIFGENFVLFFWEPSHTFFGDPGSFQPWIQDGKILIRDTALVCSVADPDLPDPRVFGPPGSGSTSQRYGSGSCSGSGPFYQHAKIVRKTLIPPILWLFLYFYLWKMM